MEQIVKNTKKEEIRRRMSHGELLRGFNNGMSNGFNNGSSNGFNNGMNNGSFNGSDVQSTNGEEEKTVFFDAQVGKLSNHCCPETSAGKGQWLSIYC